MSILRDIFRRKGRSILTIIGIAVGVFALVVLGAVAENQNTYVDKIFGYYEDVIVVVEADDANFVGMSLGSRPVSFDTVEEIRAYPGVAEVSPQVNVLLQDDFMSVVPPMVLGTEPGSRDYTGFPLEAGRRIESGERGLAVIGSDLAKRRGIGVGDAIEMRGEPFIVIGLLGRTYVNLLDASAFVSLPDAQEMFYATLPEAFRAGVEPETLVLQMNVYADDGVDPDHLAARLATDIDGIIATGPTAMMDTTRGLIALINGVVWSVAAIALIVCALSIVNTMTMAVSERTREIGVKRALGATRWRIARDVLVESGVMGGIGGLIGLLVGGATVLALNSAMVAATGTTVMVVTGRLALGAIAFAVVLGIIGGLWPARHASRLEPARALAYE